MRNNLLSLIKVLVSGAEIEYKGSNYCLSEDNRFCLIAKNDKNEDVLLAIEVDISFLSKVADEIGEDELYLKCCALSLRELF
jgi:hypothetical protein